ncbi:MAG: glycoside hydrolase family 3 C-terminal domain-containing protein, partial [Deltaproteobacteria bacterium]|nr:glycoside hydrolase family 3 C-terminal domain-containing protein [Deltaproteobacteria bacterium]
MNPDPLEGWLADLTLEEKALLLGGAELWRTRGVARLGIPPLKVSDGPTGVRGSGLSGGATAACFPCGSALAATWNPELVGRLGGVLAEEARTKGAHVVLGPTVNLHRHPFGGRHFECYSEDPWLTSRIAVALIRGLQDAGVGACIKHFVCNDSEFERHTISSEIDERTLRELYLPPFEAAVREADVASVMGAYNRVNGVHACEHPDLLRRILKEEWGFRGFVVSDWFATQSTVAAARDGLDLEMPGPARFFDQALVKAVEAGEVPEAAIEEAVTRLLEAIVRWGALEGDPEAEEVAVDRPEHRALARELAADALVLVRNEGDTLPLSIDSLNRLAVIGPNAGLAVIQGGGSSRVNPHHAVSPLAGLRARLGEAVLHQRGCSNHRSLPPLEAPQFGLDRFEVEYAHADAPGEVVRRHRLDRLDLSSIGTFSRELDRKRGFRARVVATLDPPETGVYTFSLIVGGRARLLIDGQEVVENWESWEAGESFYGTGSAERTGEVELEAGRAAELEILYSSEGARGIVGLRCGTLLPEPEGLLERAVDAAASADAAVVVVGLNADWETEGRDRETLALPGRQVELVQRVAAANPKTIVVVNAGAPVELPFLEDVPALLQFWYPGQEGGHALADVLFGDTDPGGRLPTTWPVRVEDTPSHPHYPGGEGRVDYGEGVFMGYRGYDAAGRVPALPFGHGLSYAEFAWGDLRVANAKVAAGEAVAAEIEIRNTSGRRGREVVQLYLSDLDASVPRPPR